MAVMWWMPSRRTSGGYPLLAGLAHDPRPAREQAEAVVFPQPRRVAGEDRPRDRPAQRDRALDAVQRPGDVRGLERPGDHRAAGVDARDATGALDRRGKRVVEPLVGGQAVHLGAE